MNIRGLARAFVLPAMAVALISTAGVPAASASEPEDDLTEWLSRGSASYLDDEESASINASKRCSLTVEYPHKSRYPRTPNEVHTRVTSQCGHLPATSNEVSGETFRSRWYGWESMAKDGEPPQDRDKVQTLVAVPVGEGDVHECRTEGVGKAVIAGEVRTAAAYNESQGELVF